MTMELYCPQIQNDTERNGLLEKIEPECTDVIVYVYGVSGDYLEYEQVLAIDVDVICGIAYPKELIATAGSINEKLTNLEDTNFKDQKGCIYEWLCRLARVNGRCRVEIIDPDFSDNETIQPDYAAYIYAYTIRLHMEYLHKMGIMDQTFQNVCALMQQKGCFRQFQQVMNTFLNDREEFDKIAAQTAPFLILRGDDTCGGVLQQFADDLAIALVNNGQAVIEIDGGNDDYDSIREMLAKGVVGFQTKALEIEFFKQIRGPKFQFWFDNPLRFKDILRNLTKEYYVLCQDVDHAELIRHYYNTPQAIQLPPGGRFPAESDQDDEEMQGRHVERDLDVVFVGNYFADDAESLEREQREFYEYMLRHSSLTFEQGFERMKAQNGNVDSSELIEKMFLWKTACRAVVGHFRNKVIRTILQAGITLHVYGDSWSEAPFVEYKNLIRHPQTSVEESMEVFRRAKIGLNVMSWYKAGMTERVANIMMAGAVCVSDETVYLREHTEDGKEIIMYQIENLDSLPQKLQWLLENPIERERIALLGKEKARDEFSWNARARQIIEIAEEYNRYK